MKSHLLPLIFFFALGSIALADDGTIFSAKKGVGFANPTGEFNALAPKIDQLGCSWYYNWGPEPDKSPQKIAAEFVPMIWNASECTDETLALVRKSGSKTLLCFNEPDHADQANMSVDQALALWPKLMSTGLRLGSPAPSTPDTWLPEFMRQATARGYRVDFICLHWYGDITDPEIIAQLRQVLEQNWERYHKPIWLTEFSGSSGDWIKFHAPPVTVEKNAAFVRNVIPLLESLPHVERYAWFELRWQKAPWESVALIDPKTGQETVTGAAYRTAK